MERGYVRDGVRGWPPDRQRSALGNAGIVGADIHHDSLPVNVLKAGNPGVLVRRAALIRDSGPGDVIVVALLRALAISRPDLLDVLASAATGRVIIHVIEGGTVVSPDAGEAGIAQAVAAYRKDVARARIAPAQMEAGRRRSLRAAAGRADTMAQAAWLWPMVGEGGLMTAAQIAARVGWSERSLKQHLGSRRTATVLCQQGKWVVSSGLPVPCPLRADGEIPAVPRQQTQRVQNPRSRDCGRRNNP